MRRATAPPPAPIRFSSLKDLDTWHSARPAPTDKLLLPREKLHTHTRTRDTSNKTPLKVLVCHDFKSGYQDGEDNSAVGYFPHETGEHYFLQFPQLVDVFVYFSHHRVTVPPKSWVDMLHRHAIPCLGTVILEGRDNRDLEVLVERDAQGRFVYVEKLVALAVRYAFEGWLINVETVFGKPGMGEQIVLFTEALNSELHQRIPGARCIWYDAYVASKNRVFYQNGVNELNYEHFDSCDSFFTNYWWDETILKANILNVGMQGVKKKLYVGIDIWGRGSKVGKGGFDTGLAINFLRVYSSNVALFAPAWTYENFEPHEFLEKDTQFWVGDMSDAHPGGSVATYIAASTAPVYNHKDGGFTFYTNFSQGQGDMFRVMGKTVFGDHWVNGSLQMPTPFNLDGDKLRVTKSDAFNGGSCLHIRHHGPFVPSSTSESGIDIFQFHNDVDSKDLNISVSFKQLSELVPDHYFQLEIEYTTERRYRSITPVKRGSFKIPLHASHNWKHLETTLTVPQLQPHEHCVLTRASVKWTNSTEAAMGVERSWILVRGEVDPGTVHEILLGDLMIEGVLLPRAVMGVKSATAKCELDEGGVLVEWKDEEMVLMWLVYENSKFVRPTNVPCFVSNRGDKIRVDCVLRNGCVLAGRDIFV